MSDNGKLLQSIKAFVFDVDGVFTNGSIMLHPSGSFIRMMNIKDGFAVQHAVKCGFHICIITGGTSSMVKKRFRYLGVKDIYMRSSSKLKDYEKFCSKYGLKNENVLCMGDDLPDFKIMKEAGFPCCPSDAAEEIKQISKYVSDRKGGDGCVRDVIEQVMRVQDKWINDWSFVW